MAFAPASPKNMVTVVIDVREVAVDSSWQRRVGKAAFRHKITKVSVIQRQYLIYPGTGLIISKGRSSLYIKLDINIKSYIICK